MSLDVTSVPVLNFKGVPYRVKEVRVGSLLDIEVMKSVLTNGRYGDLVSHRTVLANWNLDNVDMLANLMVLCPELVENNLKPESWRDMSIEDMSELREEYRAKFMPWFEQRLSFLNPEASKKQTQEKGEK